MMRFTTKRFYESKEDFRQFYLSLKQTACPHCKLSGYLNLHGYLRGYNEKACSGKVIRGRRIFCCGRNKRRGCGRTFSVLAVTVLRKFIIRAYSLWKFLRNISGGTDKKNSLRALNLSFSESSAYRLWKRFYLAQTKIRGRLLKLCAPPVLTFSRDPAIQTILHLKAAFSHKAGSRHVFYFGAGKHSVCPIAAFQGYFQTDFL
jgi:hypothetical protein